MLRRLCKLLRCSKQEAWQFMQACEKSAEGQRWMDAAADRPKKASTGEPMNVATTERRQNETYLPLLATTSDFDLLEETTS